jgi:hypothetical protein
LREGSGVILEAPVSIVTAARPCPSDDSMAEATPPISP